MKRTPWFKRQDSLDLYLCCLCWREPYPVYAWHSRGFTSMSLALAIYRFGEEGCQSLTSLRFASSPMAFMSRFGSCRALRSLKHFLPSSASALPHVAKPEFSRPSKSQRLRHPRCEGTSGLSCRRYKTYLLFFLHNLVVPVRLFELAIIVKVPSRALQVCRPSYLPQSS